MWSVGCILAEMLEGKPLFPGKDHVSQFKIITELLGTPEEDVLQTIGSENTLRFVKSLPLRSRVPFVERFTTKDLVALNLLEKLLVFDPKKRLNAAQALLHPYLEVYHKAANEPDCEVPFDWSFSNQDMPADQWKAMMHELVDRLTPPEH